MNETQPIHLEAESLGNLEKMGADMEEVISRNGERFLDEGDRQMLKVLLEKKKGLELTKIKGATNLSEQAKGLVEVLGAEKFKNIIAETVVSLLQVQGGGVFGKEGNLNISNDERTEVSEFIDSYLTKQMSKDEFVFDPNKLKKEGVESKWKKNTIYRIEAVVSVVNKLLWIVAANGSVDTNDGEESLRRQNTDGVKKHLRQRVILGEKRAKRQKIEKDEKVIRYLPKGGFGVILKQLIEL